MTETAPAENDLLALAPSATQLLFTEARTANTFTDEPVSEAQLRAVHELVKFAPTSSNCQPLRVLYVARGAARERLVKHLNEGNRAKTLTAPAVAVLAADMAFHENLPAVYPAGSNLRDYYLLNPAARAHAARFNATLQAGYFLLGVRAVGLAAGPMSGFDVAGVDEEFLAGGSWRSILIVNIGRPADGAWGPRLPRLGYDQTTAHI